MKETGRFLRKYRAERCLNCDTPLDVADKFCHYCGQINTTKKLSFKDFFNEFFASIFSYDSRLRHTIIALLFRPGKISKDYIEGKRARYANPFRFYLSISIIFFIISGFLSRFDPSDYNYNEDDSQGFQLNVDEKSKKVQQIDTLQAGVSSNTKIDSIVNEALQKEKKKTHHDFYYSETALKNESLLNNLYKRFQLYEQFFSETEIKNNNIALDSLSHHKSSYNLWIYQKAVQASEFNKSPSSFINYFTAKLPFIIFLFLPFFALAIWLLYIRRNFTYMEHLVFLFHTQTMFFILIGIGNIMDSAFLNDDGNAFTSIALITFLIYLFMSMYKFYGQSKLKTVVKFIILNQIFLILAGLGLFISFAVSFALY